jgi:hypothetical protein
MIQTLARWSLLVLALMLGPGMALATAGELLELADSSAQGSPDTIAATQPEPLEKTDVSSTHHQCFQQTRFPPRRAKKKPIPASSNSQATPQDRNG